jgi:hypothetical protein
MLRVFPLLALVAVTLTASAAIAQTIEATPVPAPPKPDFSSLKYFLGSWSCTSKSARRPTPQLSTSVNTLDATGRWLVEKSVNLPTSWFPYKSNELDMLTYDPSAKRWVDVETDTLGGYDVSASPGWKGDTMIWTDLTFVPNADVMAVTAVTLKKVGPGKFSYANTFTTKKGRTVGVTGSCVKT